MQKRAYSGAIIDEFKAKHHDWPECQPKTLKETPKLTHDLYDLHSYLYLHVHDTADRCVARHYLAMQVSNSLQCANAHQLHHLAADCPGAQGQNATSMEGMRAAPPVDIYI